MKYKPIPQKRETKISVKSFNGVNTADSLFAVEESQMSKGINLWRPNGVLQSRPGLNTKKPYLHPYFPGSEKIRFFSKTLPPFKAGKYCRIEAVAEKGMDFYTGLSTYLLDKNGNIKTIDYMSFVGPNGGRICDIENITFIADEKIVGSGIFMVIAMLQLEDGIETKNLFYYELDNKYSTWLKIDRKQLYKPIVWRNLHGDHFLAPEDGLPVYYKEKLEDINMVNGAFTVCFSCDEHSNIFTVPIKNFSLLRDDEVVVEYYVAKDRKTVFTFANGVDYVERTIFNETVGATLDRYLGKVTFTKGSDIYILPQYMGENTLRVTGYKYDNDKAYELFSRPDAEAYCDARLLKAGGGNSSNKIFYSGKDNPFYFCENSYVAVGDKSDAITGVAMQNRYLFIFKENKIYRLRMEDSRYYDINSIVDNMEPAKLYTPSTKLTVVHSTIGCDCPKSISFCTNRLVWYHSDGFVYALYGTNSYTEGSVYALSPNISNQLKTEVHDKYNVCATSHNGYYFLALENKIFIMDALVSGFRYLSGYKNNNVGNGGLCWYVWQMPENVSAMSLFSNSGKLFGIMGYQLYSQEKGTVFLSEFNGKIDTVMVAIDKIEEKDIEFVFSSALIGNNNSLDMSLKKISFNIENEQRIKALLKSENLNGKSFEVVSHKKAANVTVCFPPANCKRAGIELWGKGSFVINEIAFYFENRR